MLGTLEWDSIYFSYFEIRNTRGHPKDKDRTANYRREVALRGKKWEGKIAGISEQDAALGKSVK